MSSFHYIFQGHNLPSESMPGNKCVCLNFKFESGDIMQNYEEKKIFLNTYKNLSRYLRRKKNV